MDAVRRQHQRDAYAEVLAAANSYVRQTMWGDCSRQACAELGVSYPPEESREEANRRACRIRAEASTEPLELAGAVVRLEGPDHIAEMAIRIQNQAHSVRTSALRGEAPDTLFDVVANRPLRRQRNHQSELLNTISEFTEAARAHLNDDKKPKRT